MRPVHLWGDGSRILNTKRVSYVFGLPLLWQYDWFLGFLGDWHLVSFGMTGCRSGSDRMPICQQQCFFVGMCLSQTIWKKLPPPKKVLPWFFRKAILNHQIYTQNKADHIPSKNFQQLRISSLHSDKLTCPWLEHLWFWWLDMSST